MNTNIDLTPLNDVKRLLFKIPLEPLQGHRFQPTGFPALGAATFQTNSGTSLLVESTQSMANHMEITIWDDAKNDLRAGMDGLSHVRVMRNGKFLTDTILESHRLNSPYLLEGKKKPFLKILQDDVAVEAGPIDRQKLVKAVLKYDVNSLLHGVFLAKKELAGGRLRIARALSAFIEADNVRVAAYGGVKNDHVNPSGDTSAGFGNVPFARDEYTADSITLYVNLDLTQIRGYGVGEAVENLLILLALYKIRALLTGSLRLRTACDLQVVHDDIRATQPVDWHLPTLTELENEVAAAIAECKDQMTIKEVSFDDDLTKGKTK